MGFQKIKDGDSAHLFFLIEITDSANRQNDALTHLMKLSGKASIPIGRREIERAHPENGFASDLEPFRGS